MANWAGSETTRSPSQSLAQKWVNRFGKGGQRRRYVKLFNEYLETWTEEELEKIIDVLHDRHEHRQFTVTSPAIIPHVADRIFGGRFYEGKKLEII